MLKSQIVRNQCLKCGAVRYEEQRFLVMCKVCDCIMKDRKVDDRKEIDKKVKEIVEAIEEARKHPEEIEMVLKDIDSQVSLKASSDKSGDVEGRGRRLPTAESTSAPDTHNPKLKFMCTCTEPRPCSHELAIKEKTKLMTEEFNDWKECVDKEMAKHDKKIDKKLKALRKTL